MPNVNRGAGVVSRLDTIPINYLARASEVISEAGFSIDTFLSESQLDPADLQNLEAAGRRGGNVQAQSVRSKASGQAAPGGMRSSGAASEHRASEQQALALRSVGAAGLEW